MNVRLVRTSIIIVFFQSPSVSVWAYIQLSKDRVVYGATPAGITAAIQSAQMGKKVPLPEDRF